MCGRYQRRSDKQRITEAFKVAVGLDELPYEEGDDLCPQSLQPVIFLNKHGERRIEMMRWAFKLPGKLLFNAKSEGIAQSMFWKDAFLKGRCIVPGDAVYEWQQIGKNKKLKYAFKLPGLEPFGMAAVWKLWQNPSTKVWEPTFAILTGEPNERMRPIHNRMTTFLEPRDYEEYLAPAERAPEHLLRILPSERMTATALTDASDMDRQANLFDPL